MLRPERESTVDEAALSSSLISSEVSNVDWLLQDAAEKGSISSSVCQTSYDTLVRDVIQCERVEESIE